LLSALGGLCGLQQEVGDEELQAFSQHPQLWVVRYSGRESHTG
jgi:hypothetical protein